MATAGLIPNTIGQAKGIVDSVGTRVGNQFTLLNQNTAGFVAAANAAISALGTQVAPILGELSIIGAPDAPTDTAVDNPYNPPGAGASSPGGQITATLPTMPSLASTPNIVTPNIPEFRPSIGSLTIPTPPAWTALEAPDEPAQGEVTFPPTPTLVLPDLPGLVEITVPDFAGLTIPTFDVTAPEFAGTALPGILQWSEPTYRTEIMGEVLDVIRRLWSGGSGIPPAVEQAMFDRAGEREGESVRRDISAVADEFSARGFTMPTGMQAARVDQMRETMAVKKLGLNRDLTIKIAEWQIENVKFAVQQGVAAENVYINLHLNSAQRMFEAAKYQVEASISIYQAQVALFNAKMNGFQISAQVHDSRVKAELTKLEVFKAQIEAELARGQVNEQKVKVYSARVQALSAQSEVYKIQMQGAQVQSEVLRNRVETYKTTVQAFGEKIQAQKVRFDAYDSQIKGEAAKAGIIDSEARSYAALIQGKTAIVDIDLKKADVTIQNNRTTLAAYTAQIEGVKAHIQAQLGGIEANARAFSNDTQRYVAQASAEGEKAKVGVAAREATLRTNVAVYDAQSRLFIAKLEQVIRKASVVSETLKAAGSMATTLAAGSMAAVHVGATLSGGASVTASAGASASETSTDGVNYQYTDYYSSEGPSTKSPGHF